MSHTPRRAGPASAAEAGAARLVIVLALLVGFMVVEVAGALLTNSLALLADAGHVLTDAAGIGLGLLAIWFGRRPATAEKSYGYYRVEIFAAAINAMVLLAISALILFEAVRRLGASSEVIGPPMLVVAVLGLAVTAVSVRLLHREARRSLTLRAAYLELLGDLFGVLAVIVAGVVIVVTGWTPIDPIASVLIGLLILPRVWSLLRDAVDVLLQATPREVDLAEVRAHVLDAAGVTDVHDLHAWTLTSGINVVSAHVVVSGDADPGRVLDELCACLADDFDMEHSTIQLERVDRRRLEQAGHP
jgi:cobalt-zinc-cadmium efflux system protein